MKIELAGWKSEGLRCPDIEIDLRRDGAISKIALIQMPNGTGKTTTLRLLNAALSGAAENWSPETIRGYRRKGDVRAKGAFHATLLVDGAVLSLELILDFEAGRAHYKSTSPGSGGVRSGWYVPSAVRRFLVPEFLSLFIFDGEFADRLLKPEQAEADKAVDALCQLYLLREASDIAKAYWTNQTKSQTIKTSSGLKGLIDARQLLEARELALKAAHAEALGRVETLSAKILDLDGRIKERLASVDTTRERSKAAELELLAAQADVRKHSADLIAAMRLPHALNPKLTESLKDLRDNLDRLRLPENTSAQFFEELLEETECICGRPMDASAVQEVRSRAKRYLDSEDAGILNALKSDIESFTTPVEGEVSGFVRVQQIVAELTTAKKREKVADQQVRALTRQLIESGDEDVANWQKDRAKAAADVKACEKLISTLEGPGDPDDDDDKISSLSQIEQKIKELKAKIAEITETVKIRQQTDLIQGLLEKAGKRAQVRIKAELVEVSNERLGRILANDPLEIDRIDRSIRLKGQDEASVGQTLSIGYTFLMSVLNRGNNDFPLVVDSPANPIDAGVRRQVGRIIPDLCSQFVGLTINTERAGFVDALEQKEPQTRFLTLFRKTAGTARLMHDLPPGRFKETDTAVLVDDRDYFYRFDIKDEEDEDAVPAS